MKKPENLYDKNGNCIQTLKALEFIKNPKLTGDENYGIEVGLVRGENFICEDSGLFDITLSYTVIAKTDLIVYRITS